MEPLHYVIFHPETARQNLSVEGRAIVYDNHVTWCGTAWVDDESGNEDPFVLTEPWLYSYCHATQLRRAPLSDRYVSSGSVLFFCNGDEADNNVLMCHTLFVVDRMAQWPISSHGLPEEFAAHFKNLSSDLRERHFRFPFEGQHKGKYTYVSKTWVPGGINYSCLPLNKDGKRVAIPSSHYKTTLEQPSPRRFKVSSPSC